MKRILLTLGLLMATDKMNAINERNAMLVFGTLTLIASFLSDNFQRSELKKTARHNPEQAHMCSQEELDANTSATSIIGTFAGLSLLIHRFSNASPFIAPIIVTGTCMSAFMTYLNRTSIESNVKEERRRRDQQKYIEALERNERRKKEPKKTDETDEEESNNKPSRPVRSGSPRAA